MTCHVTDHVMGHMTAGGERTLTCGCVGWSQPPVDVLGEDGGGSGGVDGRCWL